MKRLMYLMGEAWRSLRANRTSTLVGILTTAFTMASFGVFLLLYVNVQKIVGSLQDDIHVVVYLKDNISPQEQAHLEKSLKQERIIKSSAFTSKQQALEEFHRQFPEEAYLLDGIGTNPLPASYTATIAPNASTSPLVSKLAERLEKLPGVQHVRYSREWVERLTLVISYLQLGAVMIGLILSLASITIIANTIRLAFYARREEIEILRLIGATGAFIAIPYLIEGAALGALGGGLSLGLLRGGFELVRQKFQALSWFGGLPALLEFLPTPLSLGLVAAGLLLGGAGSALSVYGWIRART